MPISAANISAQDVGFSYTLNGRVWRWKTRTDLTGAAPAFQVIDIVTPFGVLRDSVPLPGEIVQAMSESIDSLKMNFKAKLLVGPPSSLTFNVDEGRGFSLPQTAQITNNGVYGSLLAGTLATSASYIHVDPAVVGHLAFNQTGTFEVTVDSTDLLTSSSPYNGSITIQDTSALNSPQTLPITINVRPKASISASPTQLTFTVARPLSGAFPSIPTQQFTLQNNGPSGSVLDYQIVRLTGLSDNWLAGFTPMTGILNAAQTQSITVTVAPVEGLMIGTYQETLRISGYSVNDHFDVTIQLVIT